MAGIFDLLTGNQHPFADSLMGRSAPQTGLAGLLHDAQNAGTMALSGPPQQPPRQPWDEQPVQRNDPGAPLRRPGDKTRRIIGIIGDALAGFNGQPGQYAEAMRRRQELEQQSQLEQQRWQGQQAYKDAHPDPTSLQRNAEYLNSVHPGLGDTYLNAEGNPTAAMEVTDPTTGARSLRFYPKGNPGALGGAPSGGGAPAVGSVVQGHRFLGGNPNDQRSWAPVGGSSAPPVTGFR